MTEATFTGPRPFFADTTRGVRLYCGEALALLRAARDARFDLIFADPPYFLSNGGVARHSEQR